jgi:actin cytoskeleton-regulatory complex protein PAN1
VSLNFASSALNGNEIPEQLPEELVPASARDLNQSVDFLKDILKNETRTRSPGNFDDPISKLPTRSFHADTARGAGGRQDATIYKHDDEYTPPGGVYQPRSRHIDRDTVRTRSDDPTDDLSVMKRQLENTAKMLDRSNVENAARTREDDELEREMSDLRYRIKRLQDDLDRVSRGPRSYAKDEQRRELERELLHLMHEKLPDLEKRIEENQARKDKEKREQLRDRDRRNDRFGRFSDRDDEYSRRYDDDDRYRSPYSRDRSRERDHPQDGYDRRDYDRRDRDRDFDRSRDDDRDRDYRRPSPRDTRTPPPPPDPPSNSVNKPPPAPPPPSSTPANMAKMTKEERQAYIKAEAQRQIQERMKALGITTSGSTDTIDTSVADRLAQEKKEAEEKAKAAEKAEEERTRARQERLASEKAIKGGKVLEPPSPAPAPPTPTVSSAAKPPAPPPPKTRARPPPPPTKPSRPAAPLAPTPPAPVISEPPPPPQPDPEEERIRRREGESRKRREAMQARLRALEEEEEAARRAEAEIEKRQQALSVRTPIESPSTPVPPPVPPQPIQPVIQAPAPPTPASPPTPEPPKNVLTEKPSFNPFTRIKKEEPSTSISPSPPVTTGSGSTNPFFRSQTAPPPVAPAPPTISSPAQKQNYNTANDDTDEEWGEVVEKDDDDSSEDEFTGSRAKRTNLAEKFFGNIIPPARPQSAGPGTVESPRTPVHASTISGADSLPPPPAPPLPTFPPVDNIPPPAPPSQPSPVQTSAPTEGLSALLSAIQGGSRLKKAVTNDRSGSAISGRVVGNASPPAHINTTFNPPPPPQTLDPRPEHSFPDSFDPLSMLSEDTKSSHRLSVDWYAGLAADHSASRAPNLSSMREEEEDVAPATSTPQPVFNIKGADEHEVVDIMDDVDRSTGEFFSIVWINKHLRLLEYRVRTLFPYEGQRIEDLCPYCPLV